MALSGGRRETQVMPRRHVRAGWFETKGMAVIYSIAVGPTSTVRQVREAAELDPGRLKAVTGAILSVSCQPLAIWVNGEMKTLKIITCLLVSQIGQAQPNSNLKGMQYGVVAKL